MAYIADEAFIGHVACFKINDLDPLVLDTQL